MSFYITLLIIFAINVKEIVPTAQGDTLRLLVLVKFKPKTQKHLTYIDIKLSYIA